MRYILSSLIVLVIAAGFVEAWLSHSHEWLAPLTLEESAAAMLHRQNIPFDTLSIQNGECIPAPEHCLSWNADIIVSGVRAGRGRIVCALPAQECTVWIKSLHVSGVPIANPRSESVVDGYLKAAQHWLRSNGLWPHWVS